MSNFRTKYLKIACNLLWAVFLLIFVFAFLPKLLIYFMPFVVGMIFAMIANPMVKFLEKRIKINRKYGSVIMIVLVIGLVVLACYGAGAVLAKGIGAFMAYLPTMSANAGTEFSEAINQLQQLLEKLPFTQNVDLSAIGTAIQDFLTNFVSSSDSATLGAIGEFAKSLPDTIVGIVVGLLAAYFFIADKDKLITGVEKHLSAGFLAKTERIYKQLVHAVGGYFKAQFKIMGIIFLILVVGLGFLKVHYFVLSAFLIAFLDFLPFFGTGTAMIPWAIYAVFMGDYKRAVVLVVIYAITQIVRQLIQPKLVGDSVGLNPLVTLLLIYIGYRIGGVIWMILAVPVGMVLINMCQAGAFDYIFDDIKILIIGILKLRDEE